MSYTEEQLRDLLRQAAAMPYGAAQIALVEQVMARTDPERPTELGFQARMLGTTAYVYGGEPARSFDTFSWCLAEYDRHPDRYAARRLDLLWHFKYMVAALANSPDVSLDRTYALLDDMDARWRAGGHSLYAVYSCRHLVARHIGDLAAAEFWYRQWTSTERDELADCAGCDPGRQVGWLCLQGRYEEAVELAEPVLAGQLTCSEQPQAILTELLEPYLRTGRLEQARDAHRRAYPLHRRHLADLASVAEHVWFAAVTGNEERGLDLVERHLPWLDQAPSPFAAMAFASRAALLLRRADAAGFGGRLLRRPAQAIRPAGRMAVAELAEELAGEALELAARFDARNRTAYQSEQVGAVLTARPLVDRLVLSPLTAPAPPRGAAGADASRTGPRYQVPAEAGPDELLDLAEHAYRRSASRDAYAIWHEFDERYARADLTALQRGRRADGYALERANSGDLATAETAWNSAVVLYGEARDELRRQTARGRLGLSYCLSERGERGLPMVEEATAYVLAHGPVDRRAGAFLTLAGAYGAMGRHEDGLAQLERAAEFVADSPDPQIHSRLLIDRAQQLAGAGRLDQAREAATEGARMCRESGFSDGLARACWLLGMASEYLGEPAAALDAYDEALAAADEESLRRQLRRQRAGLLAGTARAAEAIEDLIDSVAAEVASGNTGAANAARHQLAIACLNAGRLLDAADVAEQAVAGFEADGDPHADAVRHLMATAYVRLGQPDDAIEQLETIETHCLAVDNVPGAAQLAEEIADLLDRLDRDALAAARYATASAMYRRAGLHLDAARTQRRHALSLVWARDLPGARHALEEADLASVRLPDEPKAIWERAMLGYDGAKILSHLNRPAEGAVRAAGAAARFRSVDAHTEAAYTEALRGELLLQAERPAQAEQAVRAALADLPEGAEHEDARQRMARVLATALEAQGLRREAAEVRTEYGLAD